MRWCVGDFDWVGGSGMARTTARRTAGMSDAAVKAKTGRDWGEWIAVLDKEGARKLDHKAIVKIVGGKYKIGPWWQQMVTVGYEQACGLREKHQKTDGFSVSKSKTLAAPIAAAYRAWSDEGRRRQWLKGADLTIRKATTNRSLRITWEDGETNVDVMFYAKGPGKSQVTVEHNKLATAKAGERMKAYWGAAMERLATTLAATKA